MLGLPGKSTGRPIQGLSRDANCPRGLPARGPSLLGFSFHSAPSGATADLLRPLKRRRSRHTSPQRRVVGAFSPAAYRPDLPTVGRRRVAPVMIPDHFLQATAGGTPVDHRRWAARPTTGRPSGTVGSASSRGGDWRSTKAEVPHPEVSRPGPFATAPSPAHPVAPPWLHSSAGSACGIRAGSSARVRSRTGRFWRGRSPPLAPHRFGGLSPEPLRLTRPFGAEEC